MIAIDTNIIVRFLTGDNEKQYQKAYAIFANSDRLFIPASVILESEWVLRFSYEFPAEQIIFALSGLLNLNKVHTENKKAVLKALEWHRKNMDFADAMHLAFSTADADQFISFDKKFIKKARLMDVGITVGEP